MTRLLPILLALGACQAPDAATDYAGNVYPPECPASIVSDPQWLSRMDFHTARIPQYGVTVVGPRPQITINARLSGWLAEDVKRHEICHALLALSGKEPNWHPHQSEYYANPRPTDTRDPAHSDPFHN